MTTELDAALAEFFQARDDPASLLELLHYLPHVDLYVKDRLVLRCGWLAQRGRSASGLRVPG